MGAILQHLPLRERPAHRATYRAGRCNLIELLSAIVGGPRQVEISHALVSRFGGLREIVQADPEALQAIPHMGPARISRLKAALELSRRINQEDGQQTVIESEHDAAQILMPKMSHLEQEHLYVLLLDTRHHVLDVELVYRGSLNATHIRPADVFKPAVRRNAASIVAGHNHPSGDPSPSPEDVVVTRQLIAAGNALQVMLLDHIVIGHGRYVSIHSRSPDLNW